jgi:TM2 domain-containing membrane protein YozV
VVGYFLWLFFGWFGMHRLYFGKRTSGVIYALSFGVICCGWLVRRYQFGARTGTLELAVFAAIVAFWLFDALRIPRMRREMARRYQVGRYDYSVAWLLLVLLGWLGAHRFYLQRWGTAVLYLCTGGLFGLGWLYDLFMLNEVLSDANEAWISGAPRVKGSKVG